MQSSEHLSLGRDLAPARTGRTAGTSRMRAGRAGACISAPRHCWRGSRRLIRSSAGTTQPAGRFLPLRSSDRLASRRSEPLTEVSVKDLTSSRCKTRWTSLDITGRWWTSSDHFWLVEARKWTSMDSSGHGLDPHSCTLAIMPKSADIMKANMINKRPGSRSPALSRFNPCRPERC